jgi:hypothetical protein
MSQSCGTRVTRNHYYAFFKAAIKKVTEILMPERFRDYHPTLGVGELLAIGKMPRAFTV